MKVRELYQFLTDAVENHKIDLDADVIYTGQYGYGDKVLGVSIDKKYYITDKEIIHQDVPVLSLNVDTYVFESEDVGYCNMWCDEEDAKILEELDNEE